MEPCTIINPAEMISDRTFEGYEVRRRVSPVTVLQRLDALAALYITGRCEVDEEHLADNEYNGEHLSATYDTIHGVTIISGDYPRDFYRRLRGVRYDAASKTWFTHGNAVSHARCADTHWGNGDSRNVAWWWCGTTPKHPVCE